MSLFSNHRALRRFLVRKNKSSASIAKDRLQIVVSHRRAIKGSPNFLEDLKKDLMLVIQKYMPHVSSEGVEVGLVRDSEDGGGFLKLSVAITDENKTDHMTTSDQE